MDLSMPNLGGAEATRRLKTAHPSCRILVLTVHEDRGYLKELLEAGATGYMLKRAAADELIVGTLCSRNIAAARRSSWVHCSSDA